MESSFVNTCQNDLVGGLNSVSERLKREKHILAATSWPCGSIHASLPVSLPQYFGPEPVPFGLSAQATPMLADGVTTRRFLMLAFFIARTR